jgi:hypothetical protein
MTAQQAEVEETSILTPKDLRQFDHESVALVLEYQSHGWTGWLSANQHVILRAPDGDGTASVARKYRRRRSAEIMRRPLDQWLRRKELERLEQERTDAFGRTPPPERGVQESDQPPWQIATKQSYDALLRMQKSTRDWWEGVVQAGSGKTLWTLHEEGDDDWILISGNREDKLSHIAATGRATHPLVIEGLQQKIDQANKREGNHPMEETGPPKKKFACEQPGCTSSFDTQGALNLHQQVHVMASPQTCPLCPKETTTPAAFGRHIRARHATDPRLPGILEAMGMAPMKERQPVKAIAKNGTPLKKPTEPKVARVYGMPPRPCEYCALVLAAKSIGGHHRGHVNVGHIKIADGGDAATQVLPNGAKAITAPVSPPEAPGAVTEAPAKPEPVVVRTVPMAVEPFVVNGTGKHETPEDTLNLIRMLVNPELVGENERLRTRCDRLETDLIAKTAECEETQARLDMVKEAMNA